MLKAEKKIVSLGQAAKSYYTGLGFGMKTSFDAYLAEQGREPKVIWDQVKDAIRQAILAKEKQLAESVRSGSPSWKSLNLF